MNHTLDNRINNLKKDNNNNNLRLTFTNNSVEITNADFIIIAVPTPLSRSKYPDRSYIESAARTIDENLKRGATVVLESTVYLGVTEEVIIPILEEGSVFTCGKYVKIGYSPERMNPGDDEHSLGRIQIYS